MGTIITEIGHHYQNSGTIITKFTDKNQQNSVQQLPKFRDNYPKLRTIKIQTWNIIAKKTWQSGMLSLCNCFRIMCADQKRLWHLRYGRIFLTTVLIITSSCGIEITFSDGNMCNANRMQCKFATHYLLISHMQTSE